MKKRVIDFFYNNYIWFFDLYFISIFIKSSSLIIDYPILQTVQKILRIVAFILLFIRFVIILPDLFEKLKTSKYGKIKTMLFFSILIIAVLINFKVTSWNIKILSLGLVVVSAYKVDLKKILKNILIMQLILTMILIGCALTEITRDYTITRSGNLVERHSLGFTYPTNLSQIILFETLIFAYLTEFKLKHKLICLTLICCNILAYYLTDSKTEILFFLIIIAIYVLKNVRIFEKLIHGISNIIAKTYLIIPLLSLIIVLAYPLGGVMNKINNMLSGRLETQNLVIQDGNIKLFGSDIKMVGYGLEDFKKYGKKISYEYNYIDNEYLQILIVHGIIICAEILILFNLLLRTLNKNKKYDELFFIYFILCFGVVNPRIIDLMYSPAIFFIMPYLLEENANTEE